MKKKLSLTFPRRLVSEPITYKLIKNYNLIVNIIKAKITPYEEGRLDLEIIGEKNAINEGIKYLTDLGVSVKPLIQEIKWNPDRCNHCTVCVPLCPVSAFEVDRKERTVSFNDEKCIACGVCVQACPYRAIEIVF
ncbi:4Fe-4S binding protein [Candidatus Aerophobetes bacterium]|nr:4Fe-4S binding protein [Candidatus Aerophobetes bacterium]